jgi:hypothetical protein
MSNQLKLFELFENLKIDSSDTNVFSEGIENFVPKIPTLMQKSNSKFLFEQFPEKYWPQALQQRYYKLFDYLQLLDELRNLVYEKVIEQEHQNERQYWHNSKRWQDWSKLAKDTSASLQSNAKAKAIATKNFRAGYMVDFDVAKKILEGYYGELNPRQESHLKTLADKINYMLDPSRMDSYTGLAVRKEVLSPKTIKAHSYLADFAKELEGEYGQKGGYDLNNPRRIRVHVRGKETEPRFVTDSFVMPTLERLKDQINKHKVSIASDIVKPKDEEEESHLAKAVATKDVLKEDEGLNQVAKQLYNAIYKNLLNEEKRLKKEAESKGEKYNIKKNEIRQKARKIMHEQLRVFSGSGLKEYFKNMYPNLEDKDIAKLVLPYQETEVVTRSDGRPAIQNLKNIELPKKDIEYTVIENGEERKVKANNTVLLQSQLHKPVELKQTADVMNYKDYHINTMGTTLKDPNNALGKKYFDPILFRKLERRWNYIKRGFAKPNNPRMAHLIEVENLLKQFGIDRNSELQDVINSGTRYFYQKATEKEYYQGGKTSASFSLHPTRMSAEAKFLHSGHFPNRFAARTHAIAKKGVLTSRNPLQATKTLQYIHNFIDMFLQPSARDKSPIKRLFLLRAKEIINSLIELKILENLGDSSMFVDLSIDPKKKDLYVDKKRIEKIIKTELIRYLRQDFFTGTRRKEGDFIVDLDKDSNDLSCAVSERGWKAGMCLYGADVRALQNAAVTSLSKLSDVSADTDVEEELAQQKTLRNARAKVRLVLEEYAMLFKVLLKMYKAKHVKDGKQEKAALLSGGADLTKFVADNALNDSTTFINNFYTEFNNIRTYITVGNPAAVQALSLPPEVLSNTGDIIQPRSMHRRFQRQINPQGLFDRISSPTELSDEEMNFLVNYYKKKVMDNMANRVREYEYLMNVMSEPNKQKFSQSIGNFHKKIEDKWNNTNTKSEIARVFKNHLENKSVAVDSNAIYEVAADRMPFLNNNNLLSTLTFTLQKLFGEKNVYSPDDLNNYKRIAKDMYNLVNSRGIRSQLLIRLPDDLRFAVRNLEK